jgi:hypothetical protein
MSTARLCLEPWREEGDELVVAASLDDPQGKRHRLWWRLPVRWREALTPWADPFVVAFLFPMMQWRRDVFVEGSVSPSLLSNIEHYAAVWQAWAPDQYQPIEIRAREEAETPAPPEEGLTIVPFSCGVDSSFTLYRHRRSLVGRRTRRIAAALVMHGFDIWLDQENARGMYEGLLRDARTVVGSMGVECIPVAGNFHELPTVWGHSFGTHLVGALRLLAGRFDAALVPNDVPYTRLDIPWGSHPLSNPYLASRHFNVIDDGGEFPRFEKIQVLAQWPEAMRHLRVCFENQGSHANCCRCEKCIRTILGFRAAGVELPPAFARDVSNRQIRRKCFHRESNTRQWLEVAKGAERRGLGGTGWVRAIHAAVRRNRRRWRRRRFTRPLIPLRNRIRKLFRGSPLSRKELAESAGSPQTPGKPLRPSRM